MSKLHISTLALAAMVAAGAAFPLAGRADETKTAAAALKHRWTFNTDLKDSVSGRAAVKIGANVTVAGGVAKMTGAGNSTGSLNLGMDVMPPGAATVEIWAKQTATKNYSRIFDYGPNNQNYSGQPARTSTRTFRKSSMPTQRSCARTTRSTRIRLARNTTFPSSSRRRPMARATSAGRSVT